MRPATYGMLVAPCSRSAAGAVLRGPMIPPEFNGPPCSGPLLLCLGRGRLIRTAAPSQDLS